MEPYERFDAWRLCDELALAVYKVTKTFPREERFGLASQLRRSALSAAINVAEGSAKRGSREFRRFLDIANGSLAEVGYLIRFAGRVGMLAQQEAEALLEKKTRASIVTFKLYASMKRRR